MNVTRTTTTTLSFVRRNCIVLQQPSSSSKFVVGSPTICRSCRTITTSSKKKKRGGKSSQKNTEDGKRKVLPLTKREKLKALLPTSSSSSSSRVSKTSSSPLPIVEVKMPSHLNTADKISSSVGEKLESFQGYVKSLIFPSHLSSEYKQHRIGPTMDANWWFWNILLACMPAAILVMVCEYHQDEMKEYFREQQEREKRRILGDDYADHIQQQQRLQQIQQQQQTITSSSFTDRLWEAVTDLTGYSQQPNTNEQQPLLTTDENEEHRQDQSNTETNNINENHEDVDIQALLRRVELLEKQLTSQKNNNYELQSRKEYQLQRINQSGIQNRYDDHMAEQYFKKDREQLAKYKPNNQPPNKSSNDEHLFDSIKIQLMNKINHNIEEKRQTVTNFFQKHILGQQEDKEKIQYNSTNEINETVVHQEIIQNNKNMVQNGNSNTSSSDPLFPSSTSSDEKQRPLSKSDTCKKETNEVTTESSCKDTPKTNTITIRKDDSVMSDSPPSSKEEGKWNWKKFGKFWKKKLSYERK